MSQFDEPRRLTRAEQQGQDEMHAEGRYEAAVEARELDRVSFVDDRYYSEPPS